MNLHTHPFGHQEVAQLVDEDQESEAEDYGHAGGGVQDEPLRGFHGRHSSLEILI
jgi:hypothetical protein